MSIPEPETPRRSEQDIIDDWREQILRNAGFSEFDAIDLSRRGDVDIHRAVDLIHQGCNPALAANILR